MQEKYCFFLLISSFFLNFAFDITFGSYMQPMPFMAQNNKTKYR